MRLDKFVIEKYGMYSERALSFADKPGLVVIYGPNEAGKSTCLSAISDFLFGISHTSPYGQTFGYEKMRLRADIMLSGGKRLALVRRKGKGTAKTLSDANGKTVEEAALQQILGAITRERFSALFGLNHVLLREGGESLLKADGDIGRLIVEAGGGLRTLISFVHDLDEEANGLFTPRQSERSFYKARTAFNDTDKKIKEKLLTRDAYEGMRCKAAAAEQEYERLKTERANLSEQLYREQRVARVVPSLFDLDEINHRIKLYGDLPELHHAFATAVEVAISARNEARRALEEIESRRAGLKAKIDLLVIPKALINAESTVRDIVERAVQVKNERASRPRRIIELERQQAQLAELRASIGIAPDVDIEPLSPKPLALGRVQDLAAKGLQLDSRIASLREQIEDDQIALESTKDRQAERSRNSFDQPFGIDLNTFGSLPRLAGNWNKDAARLKQIEDEISRGVQRIGFATLDELQSFSCPDASIIQTEIERQKDFEAALTKQIELRSEHARLREFALSAIAHLKQAGEVPTDRAIAAVRADRDLAWTLIRDSYLAHDHTVIMATPIEQRDDKVRTFEHLIDSADGLADRKSLEAIRIAQLDAAEKQCSEANIAIKLTEAAIQELGMKLKQVRNSFAALWPEAVAKSDDLAKLKMLVTERQKLFELTANAEELRDKLRQIEIEYNPLMALLLCAEDRLSILADANIALQARIQAITKRIKAHDDAYAAYVTDAAKVEQSKDRLRPNRSNLATCEKARAEWLSQWRGALREIRLPDDASPERAIEVLQQWSNASGILEAIRTTTKRLSQFDQDERALNELIAKYSSSLDFKLPDDPIAAADMLNQRLQTALEASAQRAGLVPELTQLMTEHATKQRQLEIKEQVLADLCSTAGSDEASLPNIATRHKELTGLRTNREQIIDTISKAGDGQPIEVLREESNSRDLDTVRAGLEQIQKDRTLIDQEMEKALGEVQNFRRALEQFEVDAGSNVLIAERERAAAEMHRIIERYMEATLARALLESAVDRLRGEKQDPLIASAGDLFAMCTQGAFSGIAADINDKGIPVVVGKRMAGGTVTIEQMSDGTRDQLYLAFRLASIEHYCTAAEPLPFIGDDLLVHFDDERSRATLDLLAQFGKTTQVLLFTHHLSVRNMATKLGADAAAVLELS